MFSQVFVCPQGAGVGISCPRSLWGWGGRGGVLSLDPGPFWGVGISFPSLPRGVGIHRGIGIAGD